MKVLLGTKGLGYSWQDEFPETTPCPDCKKADARVAFTAIEGWPKKKGVPNEYICNLHSNLEGGKFWPHDVCAFAIYFCPKCFKAITLWNQG